MFARLNINPKIVGTVAFRFFLTGISKIVVVFVVQGSGCCG